MRNAIVTGGSRGIGLSIAHSLVNAGYNVAIVGRSQSNLDAALKQLSGKGREVIGIRCDVTDSDEITQMTSSAVEKFGPIKVLVNCAGRSGGGVTENIDNELWLSVINTNLNSVFFVTKEILRSKAMGAGGAIINIASTGGKQGVVHGAPYSASKHGVIGFTKALGLELARKRADITVNAVCPGFVETEMAATVRQNYAKLWSVTPEEAKRQIEERVPLGRYIEPGEVASMVIYLASDQARGITAQAMNVCGGLGNY